MRSIQHDSQSSDCGTRTNGAFTSCHEIFTLEECNGVMCDGVCVPDDKSCVSDQDCKSIGDHHSGLLRASCRPGGVCEYDSAFILA